MRNYVEGEWRQSTATESLAVLNPATGEELGRTPLSPAAEVDAAVQSAARAFPGWRRVPVTERVQYLFKLKDRLEANFEEIARTITMECGKTLVESRGEMRRAIENVEVACGTPILIQGYNSEDIASGIDEMMIRQPLGVCAIIAPFNFPGMIPFWFLPYAIACGNTVLVKPSERVPLTMQKVFELLDELRPAAGRGEPGQRRPRGGRRDPRPPDDPGGQLRRLERGRAARLLARRGVGQTCPVPGRREEPGGGLAGRRPGVHVRDRRRQRVRLRRPALPGLVDGDCRGRRRGSVHRRHARSRRQPRNRLRPRGRRSDGAGDQSREPQAHRDADRGRGEGRRAPGGGRPAAGDREVRAGELRPPDRSRGAAVRKRDHPDRDLRSGALDPRRERTSTRRSRS